MIKIAKKEFSDLLRSRIVIIILCGYLIVLLYFIYDIYSSISMGMTPESQYGSKYGNSYGLLLCDNLFVVLTRYYGTILGVMLGCVTIATERQTHALNTLLVKPLYRDSIINGKLLGSFSFLAIIVLLTMGIYTSLVLVLCGNVLAPTLGDYLIRLPIVFSISMVIIAIFLVTSILLSLLIKSQAFAMIIGTIVLYISHVTISLAKSISQMFPGHEDYLYDIIINLSPAGYLFPLRNSLFNSSAGITESFASIMPDLFKFLLYLIALCVIGYIVFIRSDEV